MEQNKFNTMKKIFLILAIAVAIASCTKPAGNASTANDTISVDTTQVQIDSVAPDSI